MSEINESSAQVPAESAASGTVVVEVRPNLALFWLRTKLEVNAKGISGSVPNTILGIIPVGKKDISFPTRQISGVQVNTKFSVFALLAGILFASMIFSGSAGGAVIGVLFGVLFLGNAYTTQLVILNTGNGQETVKATWLDKAVLEGYAAKVRQIIHD